MQQKLYERKETLCKESPENSSAREQLPFRCPRCGEQKRFRSLSSLRAHLEYSHTCETMHNITKYSLASACKPLDYLLEKTINASSTENCKKCYPLQFQDLADKKFKDTERDKPQTLAYKRPPERLKTGSCGLVPAGSQLALTISIESHVRERLDEMMKAAECTIEKRLEKVTSELAQKNTELVNTWAEFVHLSREKREVLARERALSRQVDTAVKVIMALRQQLTESERELERKEQNLEKTINASSTENCKKCYPLQFQDLADKKFKDTERDKPQTLAYKRPPERLKTGSCGLVPAGSQLALTISIESHVRERLDEMMKAAECTIEKRLEKVTSELAQKNTELVNTWAEFVHLSREKREVLARERALSRQVDTAVKVIMALRQQLTESERELERKEQEVISIHHFLEATVQHEVCGKARLQHFIENLLQRIALAERHLVASRHHDCKKHTVSIWIPRDAKCKCILRFPLKYCTTR
ncbi:UNVERIFIED_CONTAM: hypothetical protein FKN15_040217 [Acipenser sinensis]